MENEVKAIVKHNEYLDACVRDYIKAASVAEADIVSASVYPIIRMLLAGGKKLKALSERKSEEVTDDNANDIYREVLECAIGILDNALTACGVTIEPVIDDAFDAKKHRPVKTVPTDDPSKERVLAEVITDCYLMGENVIYPAKVNVYKYKPQ